MPKELHFLFLAALVLFGLQSLGGYFQIKDYRRAVRRLHKRGNVGVGQKKGGFLNGHLVLISCDGDGIINGAEVLDGLSFLAKFKPREDLLGKPFIGTHIHEFQELFNSFDKRQSKRYKGYVQAIDALDMRLYPSA